MIDCGDRTLSTPDTVRKLQLVPFVDWSRITVYGPYPQSSWGRGFCCLIARFRAHFAHDFTSKRLTAYHTRNREVSLSPRSQQEPCEGPAADGPRAVPARPPPAAARRQQATADPILRRRPPLQRMTLAATSPTALVSGERYSTHTGFANMCCQCVARTGPGVLSATPSYALNPRS